MTCSEYVGFHVYSYCSATLTAENEQQKQLLTEEILNQTAANQLKTCHTNSQHTA